jgi:hypothetical protein
MHVRAQLHDPVIGEDAPMEDVDTTIRTSVPVSCESNVS